MKLLRKKQQPARRGSSGSVRQTRITPDELDQRYAFRRNRTLTGSLSSNVASANELKTELRSKRLQSHDLRHKRRHIVSLLFAALGLSVLLYYLIYQSVAAVHIETDAVLPVDKTIYEHKIQDYLVAHPLERFRFSLNTSSLTEYLQANSYPEVASIAPETEYDGFGTSKLNLKMRVPAVSWSTGKSDLYVDDQGNAFTRNYFAAPSVKIVDKTGIPATNNQVLASNRFLGFIGMVIGHMKQYGYSVTQVTLPVNTSRQVEVALAGISYPVRFSVDRPVGEQSEDAVRSIAYLASKGTAVAEYIDVRVSGKVYYK